MGERLESLGTTLTGTGLRQNVKPLPDGAACPDCGYFKLDYPGLLQLLAERGIDPMAAQCRCGERSRQRQEAEAARLRQANLPGRRQGGPRTFENFQAREGSEEGYEAARAFVHDSEASSLLTLVGGVGSGRTHLLEAIGRAYIARGAIVRFELVSEMLDRMRATHGDHSTEGLYELMDYYRTAHVLLLDDLGLERQTDFAVERLTALVDDRYRNGGRLAVSTNIENQDEMAEHMGDRLADRLWDRNSGVADVVYLTCGSYRTGDATVSGEVLH